MNNKDYLIQTKGRAVCLVLNTAKFMLSDMEFADEMHYHICKECQTELFDTMIQVATISCGSDEWPDVYDFLIDIGISIPDDVNYRMMYMNSIAELSPSEKRNS